MTKHPTLLPEPMQLSAGATLRLNAWAGVAVAAAFTSRLLLGDLTGLTGLPRVTVALMPLLPGLLYTRALWHWMHGLDEMQAKLQLQATCFAALAMLLVSLTVDLLQLAGFLAHVTFGWEGYFAFTFFFWTLGVAIANRRVR